MAVRGAPELLAAQDQILLLGRKSAQERVASFLLSVARGLSDTAAPRESALPMTRPDMADYLGLTAETVSRVMGRLKQGGIISLPSPYRVVIRRLAALQTLAKAEGAATQ